MSRALAEVLAATGYWPPHIEFTVADLVTVLEVLGKRN